MTGTFVIRPATPADWEGIWPIMHEVVAAGDTYTYSPDITETEARESWLPSDLDQTWVGEAGGVIGGTYHLAPNQPGAGRHVANASYLVDVAVRGQGIGRRLVQHSIVAAAALGYRAIQFNAVAATNVHAIRLYEELGFATVGRVPEAFLHPTAGYVDLLVMYRRV